MGTVVQEKALDVDILNIFENYGCSIKPMGSKESPMKYDDGIIVKIKITEGESDESGANLMLHCSENVAEIISEAFFGIPIEDGDRESMRECISELLNMIGGNLQRSLDHSGLGIPKVVEDQNEFEDLMQTKNRQDYFYELSSEKGSGHKVLQVSVYEEEKSS